MSPELIARLIGVGDPGSMIPAATAITAWLYVARRRRLALVWAALFLGGVAIVATSKIAFLAWGIGLPAVDLKAASGHAMLTGAVLPVLLYLACCGREPFLRRGAAALGFAIAALMAMVLAVFGYHSWAESLAGLAIGTAVSISALGLLAKYAVARFHPGATFASLLAFSLACLAWPATAERLIHHTARFFSAHDGIYSYKTWRVERWPPVCEPGECMPRACPPCAHPGLPTEQTGPPGKGRDGFR